MRHYTLIAGEKVLQIAPDNPLTPGGVMYRAMAFNGSIPGPPIVANVGDTVNITLRNDGSQIHSIDFHAAVGDSQVNSGPIMPGQAKTWTWKAVSGGAFFYHCSADALNGVWQHIANGMYGAAIVHPQNEKPAKEFYMVFGDMYYTTGNSTAGGNNTRDFDMNAFMAGNNNLEVTNGLAFKYVPAVGKVAKIDLNKDAKPLLVKPGELTRWYIVNAGPNQFVAFHFIAGQGDLRNGYIGNRLMTQEKNDETWTIAPGEAAVIESVFPEEGPYVGVTHKMNDVVKGGAFVVVGRNNSTMNDIPPEAMVPKPGSGVAMAAATSTSNQTSVNATNPVPNPTANTTTTNPGATTGNLTSGGEVTNSTNSTSSGGGATTSSGGATATPTASTGTSVSIVNGASSKTTDAFSPNPVSAKVGDTVTWTNNDIQPHTVTSGTSPSDPDKGKVFDSSPNLNPLLNAKATFSHQFTQAGTFQYFCQIHPTMVGTVNVS
jgi:nitrite reductase (NO-forming)